MTEVVLSQTPIGLASVERKSSPTPQLRLTGHINILSAVANVAIAAIMLVLMVKNDRDFGEHKARMAELATVLGVLPELVQKAVDGQQRIDDLLGQIASHGSAMVDKGDVLLRLQKRYVDLFAAGREQDRREMADIARRIKSLAATRDRWSGSLTSVTPPPTYKPGRFEAGDPVPKFD